MQRHTCATIIPSADVQLDSSVDGAFSGLTKSADRQEGENDHKTPLQVIVVEATCKDIRVVDIVLLRDGEEVPADCILLATSRQDGRCYVITANPDEETNLKIRSVLPLAKLYLTAEDIPQQHQLYVECDECDEPHKDLFSFDGVLKFNNRHDKSNIAFDSQI
uniref:Ptype ATPase (PATPase) Superfamily putative n=1 Tax=Albugo laibachii Nc14 TaxID=890382 RepID=F0W0U6_9STRA|nr:Ptype ATPase (PATPase) Superfamily putative [Albugo laibachii Nc14]|eukprot:CCA14670.1 Ptype ATPase (PATPase) Superfamily putative [Albugo laibachii Nc14]